jgi:putative tricarboxylic transport membrane protein
MIELVQLLPIIVLGIAGGILIGIFPGLGPASGIMLLYPVLLGLPVIHLFVFYSVMMSSVQYYGSIPSIVYGIAGEITNTPAVRYGHAEFRQGRGAELLSGTATSSLIASIVGVIIFSISVQYMYLMKYFLNNTPRLIMLTLIVILISVSSKQKILALIFAIIGLIIGHVGHNELSQYYFLSSPKFLASGIPFVPVFIGFLMLPELFSYARDKSLIVSVNSNEFNLTTRFRNLLKFPPIRSAMRGSIIGATLGLVPMVGTSISSMVAAMIEKKINNNNQKIVISAEAANNSAAITVLIPLIFLALPIVPSESVIMGLAERKGFGLANSFNFIDSMALPLLVILLVVNVVNWIIAGIFYQSMVTVYARCSKIIYPALIVLSLATCAYEGTINHQFDLYLLLTAIAILLGFFVREFSVRVALVFGMLLSSSISSEVFRFILLHF